MTVAPATAPATAGKARFSSLRRGLFALGLSFALLAALALPLGPGEIGAAIAGIAPGSWAAAIGATALVYGCRFLRWHLLARGVAPRLGWGESALVFLSGLAMALTPGKLGEALKAVELASRHGVAMATGLAVVAVELVADLLSMVLLTVLLFAFVYPAAIGIALGGIGFAAILLGALLSARVAGVLAAGIDRLPRGRGPAQRLRTFPLTLRQAVGPRGLAGALALSLLGHAGQGLGIMAILTSMAMSLDGQQAIFSHVAPNLAGALAMLPGSLGAAEFGMATLLHDLAVPAPSFAIAVAATLACRLANLWLPLVVGIGAFGWLRFRSARRGAAKNIS